MPGWENIVALKRQAIRDLIPRAWIIPPESSLEDDRWDHPRLSHSLSIRLHNAEREITNRSVCGLLVAMASGSLTSVAVIQVFCKRAAAAHEATNCLSDICFERALQDASELDRHLKETGKTMGPLHGLPVSIKDDLDVEGLDTTLGFVSRVNQPAKKDSVIVSLLRRAGAVIFVKTNLSTNMLLPETVNNLIGRTTNPLNQSLTSGGSSGGESALIASRGSPLGIGTDIGGSLRIPAACTGLCTLKPSFGRLPMQGSRPALPGQESVQGVCGPMAHSLDDLELCWKALIGLEPWTLDTKCLPIPWRNIDLPRTLKIAVMWHDGVVRPTPPVQRALRTAAEKLRAAGHEISEWSPKNHMKGLQLLGRMLTADGGRLLREQIEQSGEPWLPELERYREGTEIDLKSTWELNVQRSEFQQEYLARWEAEGIDAILCPVSPYAGAEHGKFKYIGYTGVYNVLDYSCTSFPSGLTVDAAIDVIPTNSQESLSPIDKVTSEEYNPEAVHGMPINLQLVAKRLEEEKVLSMTKTVVSILSMST